MRRRIAGLVLACAAAVPSVLIGAVPAGAAPQGPTGSAFVGVFSISSGTSGVDPNYQWNSAHPFTNVNTVTRNSTGNYTVHLPNLGSNSGTVLVNAMSSANNSCKVVSWGPAGTTQNIAGALLQPGRSGHATPGSR